MIRAVRDRGRRDFFVEVHTTFKSSTILYSVFYLIQLYTTIDYNYRERRARKLDVLAIRAQRCQAGAALLSTLGTDGAHDLAEAVVLEEAGAVRR